MESLEAEVRPMSFGALISIYSKYALSRFVDSLPSDYSFLAKILQLFRRPARLRLRRRTCYLPVPLPSDLLDSSGYSSLKSTSRVYNTLEDVMALICSNMHDIQKNLRFWESKAEGSNSQKIYFMLFERGPWAFVYSTVKLVKDSVVEGSPIRQLCSSASSHISRRIAMLNGLRFSLATFLAQIPNSVREEMIIRHIFTSYILYQPIPASTLEIVLKLKGVYIDVDRSCEEFATNPEQSAPLFFASMTELFLNLETSLRNLRTLYQINFPNERLQDPLEFEKLPEVNQDGSEWTCSGIDDAIKAIYRNLHKLDSYLSLVVTKYKKPQRFTRHWIHYSCGAVGIAACSMWLIKHSHLMGSSDINNWIREARNSTVCFFNDHVEQPLLSIRDELFETFRKRHKGVMELEEVQLTSNSLRRMLLAFSEQTKGQKFPDNASDQEMLEIVMARYETELTHPLQNLLSGGLARALLIQVQKLKLDIETAMLELNQILRANEINFAILAALPAFFLSLLLLTVIRAWLKQDTRAEGRGRAARIQRRLHIVDIEKQIIQYQIFLDQGSISDAECMYGLMLYNLDRLYYAVEGHAKATGEWQWLRQDIMDLAKPRLQTGYKFKVTSRIERIYDCLLPSPKRRQW